MKFPYSRALCRLVKASLQEDIGHKDLTTEALIPRGARGVGFVSAKSDGVLSGLPLVREIYRMLDGRVRVTGLRCDGDVLKRNEKVARLEGSVRSLLMGERVSLNFLGHLSGIASLTHRFCEVVKTYRVEIMDTRKTLPLHRGLEKYAVRCGGGGNHRMSLSDAVMIKDNHLEATHRDWKQIASRLKRYRHKPLAVEIDRFSDLAGAMSVCPDILLLDNMKVSEVKRVVASVRKRRSRILLEVSGGIHLGNVRSYARAGIDRISIGALTHSAPRLDFSLEISG